VPDKFKIGHVHQVNDILFTAGKKIVQAEYFMTVFQQPLTEVRTYESGSAGDEDSLHIG